MSDLRLTPPGPGDPGPTGPFPCPDCGTGLNAEGRRENGEPEGYCLVCGWWV